MIASMNVSLHAKNQHKPFLKMLAIYFRAHWASPCIPGHTQQKSHHQTAASMTSQLHAKNQYNNSNLSEDIDNLLFLGTLGKPRHA